MQDAADHSGRRRAKERLSTAFWLVLLAICLCGHQLGRLASALVFLGALTVAVCKASRFYRRLAIGSLAWIAAFAGALSLPYRKHSPWAFPSEACLVVVLVAGIYLTIAVFWVLERRCRAAATGGGGATWQSLTAGEKHTIVLYGTLPSLPLAVLVLNWVHN